MGIQPCAKQSPEAQKRDRSDMVKLENDFNTLLPNLSKYDASLPKDLKVNINLKREYKGSAYDVGSKIGSALLNEVDLNYHKNRNLLTSAQQAASYLQDLSETINYNTKNKCDILNTKLDKVKVRSNLNELERELKRMSKAGSKNMQFSMPEPIITQNSKNLFGNSIADFAEKYSYIEATLAESTMLPAQVQQSAIAALKAANGDKSLVESEIQKSIKTLADGLDSIVIRNTARKYPVAADGKLHRYGSAFDAEAAKPAVTNLRNNIKAANAILLELNKVK